MFGVRFIGTNIPPYYALFGFILRTYLANLNTPLNSTPFPLPIKHIYNINTYCAFLFKDVTIVTQNFWELQIPNTQCMLHLPTFGLNVW